MPSCVAAGCLLLIGCQTKPTPGHQIPTASPSSVALPSSNTAADAPNAPAVAESASGSLTTYSDPETGVSFHYPSSWRPWHTGSRMYESQLAQSAGPVKITQVFDPQTSIFAKTNLVGVSFSYATRTASNADTCTKPAQTGVPGGRQMPSETIHGVVFTRVQGGDAGMCHQVTTVLNSISRNGTCYLFERNLETVCPEVRGPGNPVALTSAQTAALNAQLERVMQSVTIR